MWKQINKKKRALLSVSLLATCFGFFQPEMSSATDNIMDGFLIKSAHIEYELSGDSRGTKTIYFDDYGNLYYELSDFVTDVKDDKGKVIEEKPINTLVVLDGEYLYNIDFQTKTGNKMDINDMKSINESYYKGHLPDDHSDELKKLGGKIKPQKKFLNMPVDVLEFDDCTFYSYKGMTLLSKTKNEFIELTEEAVSFEENPEIPNDLFIPPSDIEYDEFSIKSLFGRF